MKCPYCGKVNPDGGFPYVCIRCHGLVNAPEKPETPETPEDGSEPIRRSKKYKNLKGENEYGT